MILKTAEWAYQPGNGGLPLIVPLPRKAVAIVREINMLSGRDRYVFPSAREPSLAAFRSQLMCFVRPAR